MKRNLDFISYVDNYLTETKKTVSKIKTKWEPKEAAFTKSAEAIAKYLKSESKDLKQAMSRLNFYINRAGGKLKGEDKTRLNNAKDKLRALYGKKECTEYDNYIKEAYEMDLEGGDMGEEHAKAFIDEFIEASKGKMVYPDAQPLFNKFIEDNDADDHRGLIVESIREFCNRVSKVK